MAKVGSQGRLLIPQDLTNLIHLDKGQIGIFWDDINKSIFISNLKDNQEENCISVRSLDNKNRVIINRNILDLIDADATTELVVAARKGRIYIFNPNRG